MKQQSRSCKTASNSLIGICFFEVSDDMDEVTETISSYVLFREQLHMTTRRVKIYPNAKPWVTKELKSLLQQKSEAFIRNTAVRKICGMKWERKQIGLKMHI